MHAHTHLQRLVQHHAPLGGHRLVLGAVHEYDLWQQHPCRLWKTAGRLQRGQLLKGRAAVDGHDLVKQIAIEAAAVEVLCEGVQVVCPRHAHKRPQVARRPRGRSADGVAAGAVDAGGSRRCRGGGTASHGSGLFSLPQHGQAAEVAPGRLAHQRDAVGVPVVLGDAVAHPRNACVHILQHLSCVALWEIAVVKAGYHHSMPAEAAGQQRAPGLVPYGPGAACHVDDDWIPEMRVQATWKVQV